MQKHERKPYVKGNVYKVTKFMIRLSILSDDCNLNFRYVRTGIKFVKFRNTRERITKLRIYDNTNTVTRIRLSMANISFAILFHLLTPSIILFSNSGGWMKQISKDSFDILTVVVSSICTLLHYILWNIKKLMRL